MKSHLTLFYKIHIRTFGVLCFVLMDFFFSQTFIVQPVKQSIKIACLRKVLGLIKVCSDSKVSVLAMLI